jgi:tRNA-specific 2-thiouridylase
VAFATPRYVIRTDPATNTVWVGGETDLFSKELIARELNWIQNPPAHPIACEARIRSRSPEAEALVIPLPDGRAQVSFAEPQRAIAPGQAVVFYKDGEVLGGGWIDQQPLR